MRSIYGIFTHTFNTKGVIALTPRLTQVVPDELHDKLESLKTRLGMSKSSIVNAAIEEYIRTRDAESLAQKIEKLEKRIEKLEKK